MPIEQAVNPAPTEEKVDTWPHLVIREYFAATVWCIGLFVWAILVDAPLEEIADPNRTPNPAKAPWYFLGLQELLVYFDPWIAGVLLPTLMLVGLAAIPYIDSNPKGVGSYAGMRERKFACAVFNIGATMWFLFIIIGTFFRGPNWAWYWPWESWEIHKPLPPMTWDFPAYIGGPLLLAYFIGGTGVMRRWFRNLSLTRYLIMATLLLIMIAVPVKVILRLAFNVKYIFSWPQMGFNI